jgi:hypothetical protein
MADHHFHSHTNRDSNPNSHTYAGSEHTNVNLYNDRDNHRYDSDTLMMIGIR